MTHRKTTEGCTVMVRILERDHGSLWTHPRVLDNGYDGRRGAASAFADEQPQLTPLPKLPYRLLWLDRAESTVEGMVTAIRATNTRPQRHPAGAACSVPLPCAAGRARQWPTAAESSFHRRVRRRAPISAWNPELNDNNARDACYSGAPPGSICRKRCPVSLHDVRHLAGHAIYDSDDYVASQLAARATYMLRDRRKLRRSLPKRPATEFGRECTSSATG